MRFAKYLALSSLVSLTAACSSDETSPASPEGGAGAGGASTGGGTSSGGANSSGGGSNTGGSPSTGGKPASGGTGGGAHDGGTESGAGGAPADGGDGGAKPISAVKRVLLISVDGLHQVDLDKWITAHGTSTLATLAGTGMEFTAAHTPTPSDSFPGLLALVTGGTPKSTGVYYDDSYDRTLYAPGSNCAGNPGTEIVFDESLDKDATKLFSGGIDPGSLPLAKSASACTAVYPHDFIKVNTIFEIVHAAGGHTAWSDKHPAYDLVNGPSGKGVDDLYTPEINSDITNGGTANGVDLAGSLASCDGTTNSLPTAKVSDFTTCLPATMAYDDVKVQAIINEIDGKLSDGSASASVPMIFGMNFQTVSVGEKLPVGGYTDAAGTPSTLLASALDHVDKALGKMVAELKAKSLFDSTLIIVSAKHGQSPIDKSKLAMETGGSGDTTVQDPLTFVNAADATVDAAPSTYVNPNSGNNYQTHGHLMEDDVGVLWLQDQSSANVTAVLNQLTTNKAAIFADTLPTGTIFASSISSGSALAAIYGDATSTTDAVAAARAPDIFIQPNHGVIYSGSSKKIAEHGGGTTDDTGVALLVSLPGFATATKISTAVGTVQVAPTILKALGLDPSKLGAVAKEGTVVLPGIF